MKNSKMTENEFYEIMESKISEAETFDALHELWRSAFIYMFKSFKVGFSDKSINHLFDNFRMENSKMFWKENNPEYKDRSDEELIEIFKGECSYISDRYSYDRIFRTHWLFLRAFHDEFNHYLYPELFKNINPKK